MDNEAKRTQQTSAAAEDSAPERDEYCQLTTDFAQIVRRAKSSYQEKAPGREIDFVGLYMGSRSGIVCKADERGIPQVTVSGEEEDNQGNRRTQRFFIGLQAEVGTKDTDYRSANLAERETIVKEFEVSSQGHETGEERHRRGPARRREDPAAHRRRELRVVPAGPRGGAGALDQCRPLRAGGAGPHRRARRRRAPGDPPGARRQAGEGRGRLPQVARAHRVRRHRPDAHRPDHPAPGHHHPGAHEGRLRGFRRHPWRHGPHGRAAPLRARGRAGARLPRDRAGPGTDGGQGSHRPRPRPGRGHSGHRLPGDSLARRCRRAGPRSLRPHQRRRHHAAKTAARRRPS